MHRFALRNLVRNRARSALALLGLAGSTAGVVLLVAISLGARRMVADAMDMAKGIVILKKDTPDPLFSKIDAGMDDEMRGVAGVAAAVPEVWALCYALDGEGRLGKGIMSMAMLLGANPEKRHGLRGGGVFARTMVEGRMYTSEEPDGVVISRKLATELKKGLGSKLKVNDRKKKLVVTGIFDAGTPLYDNLLGVHEAVSRELAEVSSQTVSCYYLEVSPGEEIEPVVARLKAAFASHEQPLEVKSTLSWGREVNALVGDLDPYLGAVAVVAGAIGALGVVNTMLMSVRERVRELGVLRATGWLRRDVFVLVLIEAALLGAVGGALGALGGAGAGWVASHLLPIKPFTPPGLVVASVLGAVALGALGGLYPALYASRLDPIGAIRGGA